MPNSVASLAACALLCGSTYAEDRAPSDSNAHQNRPETTAKPNVGGTAANRGYEPINGETTDNSRSPDFSIYGTSILNWGATELLAIQTFSAFARSDAKAGTGPVSGRPTFLLKKEHDAAIKLLTTNVALNLKLSPDGVHLNLAF
jgi:hypothetical protein